MKYIAKYTGIIWTVTPINNQAVTAYFADEDEFWDYIEKSELYIEIDKSCYLE